MSYLSTAAANIRNCFVAAKQASNDSAVLALNLCDGNGNVVLDGTNPSVGMGILMGTAAIIGNVATNLLAIVGIGPRIAATTTIVTPLTPVTTNNIPANVLSQDETLYLTPAGTLAALTFTFPPDNQSRIGQYESLVSTQTITALTVSASGLTIKGTAVTAMVANTVYIWQKVAAATWVRCQ